MKRRNLLDTRNGRFNTFGVLYISEGIPYGFTSVAMVAFMRQYGVSLEPIGARNAIFMGMSKLAISYGNFWQGIVALLSQ